MQNPIRTRRARRAHAWAGLGAAVAIGLALGPAAPALADEAATRSAPPPALRQMFDIRTPMRDGVELSADAWLPDADGRYPVILIRTPYVKTDPMVTEAPAYGRYFAQHGYAVVFQDVRGRGDSGGKFNFVFQEADDGYDTIEWLAKQPWSNGRVCMMGVSYMATAQWLAAKARPPHLTCIAPTSPAGRYLDELPSMGGAFMMYWAINWLNDVSGHVSQGANTVGVDWGRVLSHRPLLTMDEALGRRMPLYREFLQHDVLDPYWRRVQFTPADFAGFDLPVLSTTGWFDGDQAGALFYWQGAHAAAKKPADQFLIIGPWNHLQSFIGGQPRQGELTLSQDSVIDPKATHLAFFDRYLKGSTAALDWPAVRIYVTGVNAWRSFDAYPIPGARTQRLYLAGGGQANTASGDGVLGWDKPVAGASDAYVYDPKDPAPLELSVGLFATDRSKVQQRRDVLVYTSAPLERTLQVIGPASVELWAASDAKDTDFTAAIEDVQPDGKAVLLGSRPVGIVRARYRRGPQAAPSLLTPGAAELYRIDLGALGHAFLPGHRIRVEVSSSAFPMFNPNQNTGHPIATDTDWNVAHQTVFHDAQRPSALVLTLAPQ